MDYIFTSGLQLYRELQSGIISYDIACQWFNHISKCMEETWPERLKIPGHLKLRPAIPKFHEPAHQQKNHHEFSCNLIWGIGACDCEGPERFWGGHNGLGGSTRTMGPGMRADTLDNHWGFWNWLKYIDHSMFFPRPLLMAVD